MNDLTNGIPGPPATESWFRALFEHSPTAMAIVDTERRFRVVNTAMCAFLGRTPAVLTTLDMADVTHPDDLDASNTHVRDVGAGRTIDWEKRYLRPNGDTVWGRVTASRWQGPEGGCWVTLVVQDITKRRRAELKLAEQEAELNTLFQEAPFPMAVNAPKGNFLRVNRAMCELVGYTREELLQMAWLDLVEPGDREASRANDELERRGETSERDVVRRILRKDGNAAYLRCKAQVVRDRAGLPRYWVGQFVDLTSERRHEAERRTLEQHLRQSQQTEAVGRVAGGVVHDFNNMLAVILNVAELARMRTTDPRMREYTEQIHGAATRAAALSRRLMSFGRRQNGQPELVDLNVVIAELRHLLQRVTGEDIAFVTELTTPLQFISIERPQLEQVLLNLAVNARDAMPLGGRLSIRTGHRRVEAGEPDLTPGDYVVLEFEDNGTGMADEVAPRAFEPFFTTKEIGSGTGLGLSIVHQVVTTAGGGVQLRTALGVGTTFLLHFPVADATTGVDQPVPEGERIDEGRGERILVVEDEPVLLDLTTQVLAEHGYVPLAAPGAEPALELVRHLRNRVDLVLTDVVMPGVSGTLLVARIRAIHPETRVLLMSGHPDERLTRHAPTEHAHALLRKPFSAEQLLRAVRRALDAPQER
ncbi:MAG: PAS domain S-box protein [Pseudomonadota bacterium]|nr:PAS domain S-box protein [Pseudomonadota bacterium]